MKKALSLIAALALSLSVLAGCGGNGGALGDTRTVMGRENHYFGMMVGFGFPEISYTRGVQKKDELKVHRLRFT